MGKHLRRPGVMVACIVIAVSILLVLPFATWQNAWGEWGNPYWFLVLDADSVRETGLPTRFIHSAESGAFYPNFVFYAGGMLALLAYPAAVLGAWPVFVLSLITAYAAAMLGAFWVLSALRVSWGKAALLAVLAGTSPYLVTDLYGRGAWAEVIGVGFTWLALGCGAQVLRRGPGHRSGVVYGIVVAVAMAIVCVTHNLSLLMGLPFLLITWAALALLITGQWAQAAARWAAVTAAAAVGLLIAAAWLVPNAINGTSTLIAGWDVTQATSAFDRIGVVLSPWLTVPGNQPARLFNQAPVLALAPVIGGACAYAARLAMRRTTFAATPAPRWAGAAILGVVACVVLVLMVNTNLWTSAPTVMRSIQFPYRLNAYLTISLVMLAGLAMRGHASWTRVVAGMLAIWYVGLAAFQITTARAIYSSNAVPNASAEHERIDVEQPPPAFNRGDAASHQFRIVPAAPLTTPSRIVEVGRDGRITNPEPGLRGRVGTNVVCSPFVTGAGGSRIVGADGSGLCVIDVSSPARPVVAAAWPTESIIGIALSVIGVIILVLGAWLGLARARKHGNTAG